MVAAFAGVVFALGLIVVARGAFPSRQNLRGRIAEFSDFTATETGDEQTMIEQIAMAVFNLINKERMDVVASDLSVTETPIEKFALEKFQTALAGGIAVPAVVFVVGLSRNGVTLIMLGLMAGALLYWFPDRDLKDKAKARREEFTRALNAWVTLVSIGISGGGGLNTAMGDASNMGRGWVFRRLKLCLEEAALEQETPWSALMGLAKETQVESLEELAGALTLAGASGARITETLVSRAESGRAKELSDVRTKAEEQSTKLGVPVGMMMFAFIAFLGYPAVAAVMSSTGG